MKIIEGNLEFDFRGADSVERLDRQGVPLPEGLKLVDFVVEEKQRLLLIEVKNPGAAPSEYQFQVTTDYLKRMQGDQIVHEDLTPKVRDSYTFLHLMERDRKPFIYVILFGLREMPVDYILYPNLKDRLYARIRQEAEVPWKRLYIKDCIITNLDNWNTVFPSYAVRQLEETT